VRSPQSTSTTTSPFRELHYEDPEDARVRYAAHRFSEGHALLWPPGRNDTCWCGSTRKYKKSCGTADAATMDASA
jgi:uncharacterized protein YecA (UPF0149 family)